MNQLLITTNNVSRVLGGLADCLILGALWIVCSIPVVIAASGGVLCGQ